MTCHFIKPPIFKPLFGNPHLALRSADDSLEAQPALENLPLNHFFGLRFPFQRLDAAEQAAHNVVGFLRRCAPTHDKAEQGRAEDFGQRQQFRIHFGPLGIG